MGMTKEREGREDLEVEKGKRKRRKRERDLIGRQRRPRREKHLINVSLAAGGAVRAAFLKDLSPKVPKNVSKKFEIRQNVVENSENSFHDFLGFFSTKSPWTL